MGFIVLGFRSGTGLRDNPATTNVFLTFHAFRLLLKRFGPIKYSRYRVGSGNVFLRGSIFSYLASVKQEPFVTAY